MVILLQPDCLIGLTDPTFRRDLLQGLGEARYREALVAFLREHCDYASWAELTFGGDDREAKITRHGDQSANEVAERRAQHES